MDVTQDGDKLKMGPDNKVYVIDLKANPPKLANTVTVGKQPSGLSFNSAALLHSLPTAPTSRLACCRSRELMLKSSTLSTWAALSRTPYSPPTASTR